MAGIELGIELSTFIDWFARKCNYTRREANGVLAMMMLTVLFLLLPMAVRQYIKVRSARLEASEAKLLDSSLATMEGLNHLEQGKRMAHASTKIHRHPFDPNTASEEELQEEGIPTFLAKRIVNYRNKGGTFHSREALGKIYDFPSALLDTLLPYIVLTEIPSPYSKGAFSESKPKERFPESKSTTRIGQPVQARVNLNEADSALLVEVRGIGPYTASKIIKYRNLLGGFISTNQLFEIYNQDSTRTAAFLPQLFVHKGFKPNPLRINLLPQDFKMYHPYLPRLSTKLIRAYVVQHGPVQSEAELLDNHLIGSEDLAKLRPYLSFD